MLIAQYTKFEIYQLIIELAEKGKSVIMVSSEMPELLGICDRILVMSGGKVAGEVNAADASQEEILESIGFKIVDFTYAEPIENRFSFHGIHYEADNVPIFTSIMFVFLLLCVIFVRKDQEYQYTNLDKFGVVCNFLTGIIAVPFITFFCILFGIVESHIELINQITYTIPPIAILCLALSVVFRRKGSSKTGFFIQFVGILLFLLIFVLDVVV